MLPVARYHFEARQTSGDNIRPKSPMISNAENGNGAQGRDRTTDTAIFSRMLYQLSYLGGSSGTGERGAVPARPAVYRQ